MTFCESEIVGLKEVVVDDIKKEIIAFANCEGGQLYIGVRDDGNVVGLDDSDDAALRISNMVRDAIKPDITMFLHYRTIEENGKRIVAVDVQRGTDRPYYIAKKGMRPEGVYVRQGFSSVPASDAAIRQMIKETDGTHFEAMRSMNQDLTFSALKKEFQRRNIDFGVQQMCSMKMMDDDSLYSNLALLLSDQCVHTIKVAVFQGTDQNVFKDRREFTGSLMQQLNEIYDYIDFRNQTHATIEKLLRIDVRDYPEMAVREALLNLLVHREYAFSASALISIYDDRIEFISVGGLVNGIELEDVMAGISVCRNQNLADVFYRLQLIEAYGTGIRKMMDAYRHTTKRPLIETTKNTFKIILPNLNASYPMDDTTILPTYQLKENMASYGYSLSNTLLQEENQIMAYVQSHGKMTRSEVTALLGVSDSTSVRFLGSLVRKGYLQKNGRARNTYYTLHSTMQ